MRFELAGGWHLHRVMVNGRPEWIICDPAGDRLGDTDKHRAELDAALAAQQDGVALAELNRLYDKHGEQVTWDVIRRLEQRLPEG